jgi:hypothetical protein
MLRLAVAALRRALHPLLHRRARRRLPEGAEHEDAGEVVLRLRVARLGERAAVLERFDDVDVPRLLGVQLLAVAHARALVGERRPADED